MPEILWAVIRTNDGWRSLPPGRKTKYPIHCFCAGGPEQAKKLCEVFAEDEQFTPAAMSRRWREAGHGARNLAGGDVFSVDQKRAIADAVQKVLRDTAHPELPDGEIKFLLHVEGAGLWSWADIRNNGAVTNPSVNPWNEAQASKPWKPDPREEPESMPPN